MNYAYLQFGISGILRWYVPRPDVSPCLFTSLRPAGGVDGHRVERNFTGNLCRRNRLLVAAGRTARRAT